MPTIQTMDSIQKRWLAVFLGAYSSIIATLLACLLAA